MIDSILNEVIQKRPELSRFETRALAIDIYYSGESPNEILGSESTINRLLNNYKSSN